MKHDALSEQRPRPPARLGPGAGHGPGAPIWSSSRPPEIEALLHEFGVYQIELETQNEELRETRLALEAARDRYRELYDFAPVGYFTFSGEGMIIEANLAAGKLLEVERRALAGQFFSTFLAPAAVDDFLGHLQPGARKSASSRTRPRSAWPTGVSCNSPASPPRLPAAATSAAAPPSTSPPGGGRRRRGAAAKRASAPWPRRRRWGSSRRLRTAASPMSTGAGRRSPGAVGSAASISAGTRRSTPRTASGSFSAGRTVQPAAGRRSSACCGRTARSPGCECW